MPHSRIAASCLAGLIALGCLAACSDEVDPATEAVQMFCSSADQTIAEVSEFQQLLAGDATVDALRAQGEAVRTELSETALAAQELVEGVGSELQAATAEFEDSLQAIGDSSVSIEEAKSQAETAAQAYRTAVDATKSELGCVE